MQLVLSLSPGGTERLVIELCRRLANDTFPDAAAAWSLVRRRYAVAMGVVLAGIAVALAEIALSPSKGLAPWFYLLLIAAGIVRPPRRRTHGG